MTTSEQQDVLDALAEAAIELEVLLPDTCVVRARTPMSNDRWGGVVQGAAVDTEYQCRFKRLGGREAADAARVDDTAEFKLVLPIGADINEADEVIYRGRAYPVVAVMGGTFSVSTTAYLAAGRAS